MSGDISLYVPWDSCTEMEKELNTMARIHKKNMHEICELRDSIRKLPFFDIMNPVKIGESDEGKKQYLEEENKNLQLFEEYNSEFNWLLKQEARLLQEIKELENSSNQLTKQFDELEDQQETAKKLYQSQKSALDVAKEVYKESFGMDIAIEDYSNDVFRATLTFSEINDFMVTFTINRLSATILDFNASPYVAQDELQKLKNDFEETNNTIALISCLRNLAMRKLIN